MPKKQKKSKLSEVEELQNKEPEAFEVYQEEMVPLDERMQEMVNREGEIKRRAQDKQDREKAEEERVRVILVNSLES
jgi:hypothetical protein